MFNTELLRSRKPSFLAFFGAIMAAFAIGLSAYTSHGVDDEQARSFLRIAAIYVFAHGLTLAALAPATERKIGTIGLITILLGTIFFSGSLIGKVFLELPTALMPVGGAFMMLGWIIWALDALRR